MQKHTIEKDTNAPKAGYSKPVLSKAGSALRLTRGGSGDDTEGKNIVWSMFTTLPLRPRD